MRMAWVVLFLAGLFEIAWAVGLKYTDGFTRLGPTLVTGVCLILSMALLGVAVRTLPLGSAYAVWTGIGTIGTVVLGIVIFDEPTTVPRLICVGLIMAGILGLKLTSAS
jgi:quaternary ammonium compound-resistance protein SugE